MNSTTIMTHYPLAEIPVFDLNGPAFLMFYGVMFGIALCGSIYRSRRMVDRFDRSGHQVNITDPYDTAYLAGGAPRVAQLTVVRLMQSGHVEWKSGFTGRRLIAHKPDEGTLNGIERRMWMAAMQKGKKGIPVADAYSSILTDTRAFEVKLAAAGLRPTQEERRKAGWLAVIPLIALLVVGFIKLLVGVSRDKPVMFLVMCLIITLIVAIAVGSSTRRLTKTGEQLLARLRLEQERPQQNRENGSFDSFDNVCWNLALMGPVVLAGIPAFSGMHKELQNHMGPASSSSSSGCGTSGCGGSGCGGGGGCGGCGGD